MSEPQQIDPAGNTQQFKAFAQQNDQSAAPEKTSYVPLIIGVAALLVVAVVVLVVLL
jgi:hypothetical protein